MGRNVSLLGALFIGNSGVQRLRFKANPRAVLSTSPVFVVIIVARSPGSCRSRCLRSRPFIMPSGPSISDNVETVALRLPRYARGCAPRRLIFRRPALTCSEHSCSPTHPALGAVRWSSFPRSIYFELLLIEFSKLCICRGTRFFSAEIAVSFKGT